MGKKISCGQIVGWAFAAFIIFFYVQGILTGGPMVMTLAIFFIIIIVANMNS